MLLLVAQSLIWLSNLAKQYPHVLPADLSRDQLHELQQRYHQCFLASLASKTLHRDVLHRSTHTVYRKMHLFLSFQDILLTARALYLIKLYLDARFPHDEIPLLHYIDVMCQLYTVLVLSL